MKLCKELVRFHSKRNSIVSHKSILKAQKYKKNHRKFELVNGTLLTNEDVVDAELRSKNTNKRVALPKHFPAQAVYVSVKLRCILFASRAIQKYRRNTRNNLCRTTFKTNTTSLHSGKNIYSRKSSMASNGYHNIHESIAVCPTSFKQRPCNDCSGKHRTKLSGSYRISKVPKEHPIKHKRKFTTMPIFTSSNSGLPDIHSSSREVLSSYIDIAPITIGYCSKAPHQKLRYLPLDLLPKTGRYSLLSILREAESSHKKNCPRLKKTQNSHRKRNRLQHFVVKINKHLLRWANKKHTSRVKSIRKRSRRRNREKEFPQPQSWDKPFLRGFFLPKNILGLCVDCRSEKKNCPNLVTKVTTIRSSFCGKPCQRCSSKASKCRNAQILLKSDHGILSSSRGSKFYQYKTDFDLSNAPDSETNGAQKLVALATAETKESCKTWPLLRNVPQMRRTKGTVFLVPISFRQEKSINRLKKRTRKMGHAFRGSKDSTILGRRGKTFCLSKTVLSSEKLLSRNVRLQTSKMNDFHYRTRLSCQLYWNSNFIISYQFWSNCYWVLQSFKVCDFLSKSPYFYRLRIAIVLALFSIKISLVIENIYRYIKSQMNISMYFKTVLSLSPNVHFLTFVHNTYTMFPYLLPAHSGLQAFFLVHSLVAQCLGHHRVHISSNNIPLGRPPPARVYLRLAICLSNTNASSSLGVIARVLHTAGTIIYTLANPGEMPPHSNTKTAILLQFTAPETLSAPNKSAIKNSSRDKTDAREMEKKSIRLKNPSSIFCSRGMGSKSALAEVVQSMGGHLRAKALRARKAVSVIFHSHRGPFESSASVLPLSNGKIKSALNRNAFSSDLKEQSKGFILDPESPTKSQDAPSISSSVVVSTTTDYFNDTMQVSFSTEMTLPGDTTSFTRIHLNTVNSSTIPGSLPGEIAQRHSCSWTRARDSSRKQETGSLLWTNTNCTVLPSDIFTTQLGQLSLTECNTDYLKRYRFCRDLLLRRKIHLKNQTLPNFSRNIQMSFLGDRYLSSQSLLCSCHETGACEAQRSVSRIKENGSVENGSMAAIGDDVFITEKVLLTETPASDRLNAKNLTKETSPQSFAYLLPRCKMAQHLKNNPCEVVAKTSTNMTNKNEVFREKRLTVPNGMHGQACTSLQNCSSILNQSMPSFFCTNNSLSKIPDDQEWSVPVLHKKSSASIYFGNNYDENCTEVNKNCQTMSRSMFSHNNSIPGFSKRRLTQVSCVICNTSENSSAFQDSCETVLQPKPVSSSECLSAEHYQLRNFDSDKSCQTLYEQRKNSTSISWKWTTHFRQGFWRIFFFLMIVLSMSSPGSACPSSCVCKWKGGKETVECVNKGLTTLPVGLKAETQVLDFTGNSLGILSREKFKILGLINLQRIYVSRCKLVQLDDSAFRGLSNLVELDLSNNELNMVPSAALEHTAALMRLLLSHNPITQIRDGAFSKLHSLTSLEMTGCALQVLQSRAFQGLDKLEWLKLDDNQLTSVPETMLLPKMLHGVDLHNNPWHCDCKLQHLRSWLVKYNVPSSIEPKCSSPLRLETRIIKLVYPEDFACPPEIRPTSLFLDVLEGKNVSFACHVVAEPTADIEWRFNGYPLQNSSFIYDDATSFYIYEDREIKEETVSYLRIEMVTAAHGGIFQCAAENTAGKMISNFTLRVSIPPTVVEPNDFIEDNFKYIGIAAVALVGLIILVIIFCCILLCLRCRRKSRNQLPNDLHTAPSEKSGQSPAPISSMPKYIQMGTPTPKANGISNTGAPISVIEASPYRSTPPGAPHPNPDLISDGAVEERVKPKKKVSIMGVEEVDPNGVITTRKLNDIVEEYEENCHSPYDQSVHCNQDYDASHDAMNPYSNISTCTIIANTNPYPLIDIPPNDLNRPNIPLQNRCFDSNVCRSNGYSVPKDDSWIEVNGNRLSESNNVMMQNHSVPAYATLRRNVKTSGMPRSHLLLESKCHSEEYPMQTNYQNHSGRFTPSYGVLVEKYHSDGTSPTTASTSLTGCDCCPEQKTCDISEPTARMSGDGCSFDNLLGSCSSGAGSGTSNCCFNETNGRIFDNRLPENYTTLTPSSELKDPVFFGSPGPLPPEGWRDSDCANSEFVKDNNTSPWDNMPLSPSTRILYSPEEGFSNVISTPADSEAKFCIQQKNGKSNHEILPPATQV